MKRRIETSLAAGWTSLLLSALLGVGCRRGTTPPDASSQPAPPPGLAGSAPAAAVDPPPLAGASATSERPIAPAPAEHPAEPILPQGKLIAWQIEQDGHIISPAKHVVTLARKAFT